MRRLFLTALLLLDMTRQELAKQGQTGGFSPRVFKFIPPGKFNQL